MDLLIVIIREIGHLLGHDYVAEGLIAETLTAGKHRSISYQLGRCCFPSRAHRGKGSALSDTSVPGAIPFPSTRAFSCWSTSAGASTPARFSPAASLPSSWTIWLTRSIASPTHA